jgi:hypothetical protein
MTLVEKILRGPLLVALLQAIDAALRSPAGIASAEIYQTALAALLVEGLLPPAECQELVVASAPSGSLYTLSQLQEAATKQLLVHANAGSQLVDALLGKGGAAVVPGQALLVAAVYEAEKRRNQPPAADKANLGEAPERAFAPSAQALAAYRIERCFVFPLPCPQPSIALTRSGEALCAALLNVLRKSGSRQCNEVALGSLKYPGSGAGERLAITQPEAFALSPLSDGIGKRIDGALVINNDHPTIKELLPLAEHEPELAAYTLLKHCYLGLMTDSIDSALFDAALEGRWRRIRI